MLDWVSIVKIIDPIVQSLLLVMFIISLDEGGSSYRSYFFSMIGLQVVSFIFNLVVRARKKLKKERWAYIALLAVWGVVYYYVKSHVHERYFKGQDLGVIARSGVYEFYLMLAGSVLYGWYSLICFREIKGTVKRRMKD